MKLYDTKAVSRFLDLTERRIRQLKNENIIEEFRPGLYDLRSTLHKYINYLRKGNPGSDESIDYNTERAKLMRAKRRNEEFELMLKQNELHYSEEIERVMTGMLINFKNRLMAIPNKLSPILSKKTSKSEIFKILKEHIDEALNELSDYDSLFSEETDNEEGNN